MAPRTHDTAADVDVLLVGGGIMSATLASLLGSLEPDWRIEIHERLDAVALESSNPWNNAGTGHAALCELNYTPQRPDGTVDVSKAVRINEQYELSRELWHHLAAAGRLPGAADAVSTTPHMTFVRGAADVEFLRRRWEALRAHPLFAEMEFTTDPAVIERWAPLLMAQRTDDEPVAATRATWGTDVDFGSLTRAMLTDATTRGARLHTSSEVTRLKRLRDGRWRVTVADRRWNGGPPRTVTARFVFVGAGGGALHLLQRARIKEIRGYAGFPISGQFLRTTRPEIVEQHRAKVYGKAAIGAPPMSVPHLDARVVDGGRALMFGPYAGWSMKFLKRGSWTDLLRSVRPGNLVPMLAVGLRNVDLLTYLVREVTASDTARLRSLRAYMPSAHPRDWELVTAGQRVQVIKRGKGGGVLEFGTELVASADGSIAGLLGASPGASTAVATMLDLLDRCFPEHAETWRPRLHQMMPSLGGAEWDAAMELHQLVDDGTLTGGH
ncbi:malate dehydrogenase (quinone) [Cellulomonas wangsupingiae]|uniref:Probable malate:quinone oxidoreductase n=1 Tax=Cellulomonas wangsupingiae TaxID=2968085 RepID=A0ABY5K123_9CELL|nr:malate dehydrogenase (quinone) [Cellulomonas wangsupingiae]MCC2333285.1 malate dehydrogenase (quinone) [Cellulomonas wangsupingiae]UUI63489.1 malate dehydrogenase (quinone) [Cellulomonas wangsupingiae]